MYGFCRLGLRPRPSAGAAITSNGLATATSSHVKPTMMPPSTGTTHTTRSRARLRLIHTTSAAYPVRISSQSSNDPSCPPQSAETLYGVGRATLEWPATYASEKSSVRNALTRTPVATSVDPKAAISALRAETASLLRPRAAA